MYVFAGKQQDVFGEYVVRCLFSRTWSLREAALHKIELDLAQYPQKPNQDNCSVFTAVARLLAMAVTDKIAQVFLRSLSLCRAVLATLAANLQRQAVHSAFDQFAPDLVKKLGDSNPRVRLEAGNVLVALAEANCVGPAFIADFVLRPPKQKSPKPILGRLNVLEKIVAGFGFGRQSGMSSEAVMGLMKSTGAFSHANSEVRKAAQALTMQVYRCGGDGSVRPFLSGLRAKQLQEYESGFRKISGSEGGGVVRRMAGGGGASKGGSEIVGSSRAARANNGGGDGGATRGGNAAGDAGPVGSPGPYHTSGNDGGRIQAKISDAGPGGQDINININLTSSPSTNLDQSRNAADNRPDDSLDVSADPLTCQFCGKYDDAFVDGDVLDLHYWKVRLFFFFVSGKCRIGNMYNALQHILGSV